MEEKKRKKRTREYLQQLQDKVLEEEAALLEGAEGSQVAGSKRKEIATGEKYSPIGENWGCNGAEIGLGKREREGGERR